ncbi:hypothetical protein [Neisseria bergeri]|uniref:hypothetical protein n=1 Tax=Neisseria bergeri TaxID=1906581 RepID=UPI0027DF5B08|nr:hypothetical protein [Neisseria bergeri]
MVISLLPALMPDVVTLIVFALDVPAPAAAPFVGVMVKPSLSILVLALPVPPFASLNSTLVRSFSSFFSE